MRQPEARHPQQRDRHRAPFGPERFILGGRGADRDAGAQAGDRTDRCAGPGSPGRVSPADQTNLARFEGQRTALRELLQRTQPASLALFAVPPQTEKLTPFLQRLSGLVKYALRANDGQVSLAQLAAAAAQGELTVRLGLDWLAAKGYITIVEDRGRCCAWQKGRLKQRTPPWTPRNLQHRSLCYWTKPPPSVIITGALKWKDFWKDSRNRGSICIKREIGEMLENDTQISAAETNMDIANRNIALLWMQRRK